MWQPNRYPRVYIEPENMDDSLAFNGVPLGEVKKFRFAFKDIIKKDSDNKNFGFSVDFLNMEGTDIDMAVVSVGGNNNCSMDCAFSIGNYDAIVLSYSNHRWLLVELKLNSTVAQNDKDALLKKVVETEKFITEGSLDADRIFVYPDKVYPGKKSLFDKWKNGSNGKAYKNWVCLSPVEFEKYLLLRQNIKYIPDFTSERIENSFEDITDPDEFYTMLTSWKNKAEEYRNQGNKKEFSHIMTVIAGIYRDFMSMGLEDTDKLLLKMYWDFLNDFL